MTDTVYPFESNIPVSALLVDLQNPRLPVIQDNQREAIQSMIRSQGEKIVALAHHILKNKLNPAVLPIVSPSEDEDGMFDVLDGNRRITALKILETPELAQGLLDNSSYQKLQGFSNSYRQAPLSRIRCIVFANRDSADPWIQLIHRGELQGTGLVEWDGQVAARYDARRGKKSVALQILDFARLYAKLSNATNQRIESGRFPITTLTRLISSPYIRGKIGIEISRGQVLSRYSRKEVLKGLTKILEDLGSGTYTVSMLKNIDQRLDYIDNFLPEQLPNPQTRISPAVLIELAPDSTTQPSSGTTNPDTTNPDTTNPDTTNPDTTNPDTTKPDTTNPDTTNPDTTNPDTTNPDTTNPDTTNPDTTNPDTTNPDTTNPDTDTTGGGKNSTNGNSRTGKRPSSPRSRVMLIPRDCKLQIPHHRIYKIYMELKDLNVDQFTNSGAVLLRVFLELSLDYFIEKKLNWNERQRQNSNLAFKLNTAIDYMRDNSIMTVDELTPVMRAAAGQTLLAASVKTMHSYVHNRHSSPTASDLRIVWDDLQRFIEQLWLNI